MGLLCVARAMGMLRRVALLFAAVVLLLRFESVQSSYEGTLECEELTALECAYAVSSEGARCVLEKTALRNGDVIPICQTSMILAERPGEWIESDECIQGCGLERQTYGLSTDGFMESSFIDKICSAECQNNCPNIVDIYFQLAAGEGVYLPRLCNENKFSARRLIADPALVVRNGPEADHGGGRFMSSTHVDDQGRPWDSSFASSGTPAPQSSPVYGPVPFPKSVKSKHPLAVAPAPSPSPSPLSEPISKASSVGFNNDFEDVE